MNRFDLSFLKIEMKKYKSLIYIVGAVIAVSFFIATASNSNQPSVQTSSALQIQNNRYAPSPQPTQQNSGLSNDNSYTNVNGDTVHSPAYINNNSAPVGATAQCRDGTYSFSQNRRGTCSHHGGVAQWL